MQKMQIDSVDQKILFCLVKNARMPFLEIARECGLSGAAVHQRVKRLEDLGIITGSRLLVKPKVLGLKVCAFVAVTLSNPDKHEEVIARLKKIPEIVECHYVTGEYSLLLKVYCHDHEHLMQLLLSSIQEVPYIHHTRSLISMSQPIDRQVWVKDEKLLAE